ncbi:hypothetical protein [Jannaschia sp. LMIT008]|uniref:hypothetical protein n=1 Tax=Jannaschia maritima TaxID=3032585 RepID=UPI002811060F|nr:hypothetical protein [Jannaschia sp. LMIT008]
MTRTVILAAATLLLTAPAQAAVVEVTSGDTASDSFFADYFATGQIGAALAPYADDPALSNGAVLEVTLTVSGGFRGFGPLSSDTGFDPGLAEPYDWTGSLDLTFVAPSGLSLPGLQALNVASLGSQGFAGSGPNFGYSEGDYDIALSASLTYFDGDDLPPVVPLPAAGLLLLGAFRLSGPAAPGIASPGRWLRPPALTYGPQPG